jgi:hypothetical protein
LEQNKSIDLMEWESLFRHPNWEKVQEVLSQRIDSLNSAIQNRAKVSMDMNKAFESAGDLRVIAEFTKLLQLFESLKIQIVQNKKGEL